MTYKDLVNSILRRLRETEVGSVTETAYSKLVGAFVNDAKRLVEDSWQWNNLLSTVTVTTEAGSKSYDLEDYSTDTWGYVVSDRARLWVDPNTGNPLVTCVTAGQESVLCQSSITYDPIARITNDNDSYTGLPTEYYISVNAGASPDRSQFRLNFYPTPDAAYQYRIYLVNPQADLSSDNEVIRVPYAPILQMAYLFCLYERGEEVGEMLSLTAAKADQSLGDAIAQDLMTQGEYLAFSNE